MRNTKHQPLICQPVGCRFCGCKEASPLDQLFAHGMVKCQGCSLIYRNPPPTSQDLARAYSGDRTDLTQEERVGERRKQHFNRLLKHAGVPGRLLDVGCGCGFFLKLAQEAGWEAIGVDLNPKAITYAKERLRVNALLGDLRDIHFPDGSFNLVTLWNVLDHVSDPVNLLLEVHRVLNDDGRVLIRIPNADWHYLNLRLASFLRHLGWSKVFEERPHIIFIFHQTNFSPFNLRLALNRSGFFPLSIRNSPPVTGDPYLGLGPLGKRLVALVKLGIYGIAQGVAIASGGRWLIGPSLEAWARRVKIPEAMQG